MDIRKPSIEIGDMAIAQFLDHAGISDDEWEKSGCDWEELQKIAVDHQAQWGTLNDAAEFFGKTIQRFSGVHSVRWRVKDVGHLLKKIIRKCAEGRYKDVTVENYFVFVTDLIGIRALHLFKDDWIGIHRDLRSKWQPLEGQQIAYIRQGDQPEFTAGLEKEEFKVEVHKAGYRSLHYVFEIKPTQRAIRAEVQVRTIFEEGWSEIDHTLRYPDFSDNAMVLYCLQILNRMAGSADEMGGFVRGFTRMLADQAKQFASAISERDDALAKRDDALAKVSGTIDQIVRLKESNTEMKQLATTLQEQLKVFREREALAAAINPDRHAYYELFGNGVQKPIAWPNSNLISNPGSGLLNTPNGGIAVATSLNDPFGTSAQSPFGTPAQSPFGFGGSANNAALNVSSDPPKPFARMPTPVASEVSTPHATPASPKKKGNPS